MPMTAHDFLTDEGAYVHEHVPESWYDGSDPENGPEDLQGGPAFDVYSGDSHDIFIQDGLIVHMSLRDFNEEDLYREEH